MSKESKKQIVELIEEKLTDFEKQVFELMLSYFNYKEIADMLDKEPKQVDNAIQRIKVKVKSVIKNYDEK